MYLHSNYLSESYFLWVVVDSAIPTLDSDCRGIHRKTMYARNPEQFYLIDDSLSCIKLLLKGKGTSDGHCFTLIALKC